MIHTLKQKTKEALKSLDEQIKRENEAIQQVMANYQRSMQNLGNQKRALLDVVVENLPGHVDGKKYNLLPDYTLEEISEEEFEKLTQAPGAEVINTKFEQAESN